MLRLSPAFEVGPGAREASLHRAFHRPGYPTRYWSTMGVAGENAHGEPYTVDSLPDAVAVCDDVHRVSIDFGTTAGVDKDESLFAFAGSEVIEQKSFDREVLDASAAPLVVTLRAGTGYHDVMR